MTGITTMFMNERMDEGDILLVREVPIAPGETAGSLEGRLGVVGAELLIETIGALVAGRVTRRPQDHSRATLAPRLAKEDGRIRWEESARAIVNRARAATPRPGAFTRIGGKVLKVWEALETDAPSAAAPGTVLRAGDAGIVVAAGDGRAVLLTAVQAEGKRRLPAGEFLRGSRIEEGTVLDGG
jgi:methionyl-tRNA formyltransferase